MAVTVVPFRPGPLGSIRAAAPNEIPDEGVRTVIDGLLDEAGLCRRRGPVRPITGVLSGTAGYRPHGLTHTVAPDTEHTQALWESNTGTGQLLFARDPYSASSGSFAWPFSLGLSDHYGLFDSKPALNGGAMIGVAAEPGGGNQAIALWRGASKPTNSFTCQSTVNRGTTSITIQAGQGVGVTPGHFLFRNQAGYLELLGVVKSVAGDVLTLEAGSLQAVNIGDALQVRPVRGINPRVSKGRITASTGSTQVSGANTKFRDQGIQALAGGGPWDIYRASDMVYIGTVSTVSSNEALTLTANAAVSVNVEDYLAIKRNGIYDVTTTPPVGYLNTTYAGRQIYACLAQHATDGTFQVIRLWYSDNDDPEAVDPKADFIDIQPVQGEVGPILGIVGTESALLVFFENETHAIFGTVPETWQARKILDDGALDCMAIDTFGSGAIWAGKKGVYMWDGVEVRNLTEETLGDFYGGTLLNMFNLMMGHRAWGMTVKRHFICFVNAVETDDFAFKGASAVNYDALAVVVNLDTNAATFFTPNVSIRGRIHEHMMNDEQVPTIYVVNLSTNQAKLCNAADLFDDEAGNDTITTDTGPGGTPDLYIESKRYNMGDPQLKKLFKQLQLFYISVGGSLRLDTVVGLGETGTTTASEFTAKSALDPAKRIKFLKRSQHFGFRLWQSPGVTRALVGSWGIGFKPQRPGRV